MRMTKQRKEILSYMDKADLVFGYTDQGNRMYFFTDGKAVSDRVVEGMIACGLLKFTESPLGGLGQEIVRA